ncbi:MAG: DUF1501 domain-containing protein [Isosphaeraceae bacterium]
MFSIDDRPVRLCDGVNRREWLRVGGLSTLGLSLAGLLRHEAMAGPSGSGTRSTTFGKAKSVIFLWLQGGPPQHETFDPKPDAPAEIRGPFKPIQTNVPGIHFGELLPRTARIADKLAVVRSIATDDNNHDVSGYWVLTGYPYGPGSAREIKPNDWPYFGSVVKKVKPSDRLPALTSVWLPDMMRLNDNVTPAGQTAGFLGKFWEPERFVGDPSVPGYQVEGLTLPANLPTVRVDRRRDLLRQIDPSLARVERSGTLESWDRIARQAYDLVTSGRARTAFDLDREPEALRDRYGRHGWGQSVLLARRLVEAGVRLVHVNWSREPGDSAVDNPMWDTHTQNADRLQDVLCPQFDVTFPTLIEDLESRGLLDETLVVAIGEFGRTPKINGQGGRDHWGHVFSFAMAGAGIRGGQVFGASDKQGGFPAIDPIRPHDLTATIFHLLGIDPGGTFLDRADRPHLLTRGEPLTRLLGHEPATLERVKPEGDLNLVPSYDTRLLLDTEFESGALFPPSPPSRQKGWRGFPLAGTSDDSSSLTVMRVPGRGGDAPARVEFQLKPGQALARGARAILAQEIRNARGGRYTLRVRATAGGASRQVSDPLFRDHLDCRLILFRFADTRKDPRSVQVLASQPIHPEFVDLAEVDTAPVLTLSAFLGSTVPGTNFATGNGLGVALSMEVTRPIEGVEASVILRVHSVALEFDARPRDDSVTV